MSRNQHIPQCKWGDVCEWGVCEYERVGSVSEGVMTFVCMWWWYDIDVCVAYVYVCVLCNHVTVSQTTHVMTLYVRTVTHTHTHTLDKALLLICPISYC